MKTTISAGWRICSSTWRSTAARISGQASWSAISNRSASRFGPHVNAYTSFDETVYMLDVPTDKPGVLNRGFEALSDFAGGASLTDEEIDRERGVVIEEWRGRLGAGTRLQQPQMDALFGANSKYAQRLPIGLPEIIRTVQARTAARLLPHALPPGSHGGYRRRRHRPRRHRAADPDELRRSSATRRRRRISSRRFLRTMTPGTSRSPILELQGSSVSITHKRPLAAAADGCATIAAC